jgi:hemolysin D
MSIRLRFAAYGELLRRYREAFAFHWQHGKAMSGVSFNVDEAEFLPPALAIQERPVSPVGRWVARILILLVVVLLVWSVLGRIDIIANASGKIIPSAYTQTIGSVDVASVRAIHVKEGQRVRKGDALVELDTSASDAEHNKAQGEHREALLQIARARALIAAVENGKAPELPPMESIPQEDWLNAKHHLEGEYQDYRAKLKRLDDAIAHFSRTLPLAVQTERDYKSLVESHDVAVHAYLEKEQARIELEGQLEDARNQRRTLITETRKTALDAVAEASKLAGETEQDALRAASHSKLLKLIAPMDGTVQQLTVHTVGGVVPAAQPLMQVVPTKGAIEVEAVLENKDVGFVEEGQPAEVKVEAFDYTKYGTIPAHVSHVSRDAIQDEKRGLIYTVRITLDKSSLNVNGHDMPLLAGMSVSVEIKTGTRRVIEYVLSPLLQYSRETLRER